MQGTYLPVGLLEPARLLRDKMGVYLRTAPAHGPMRAGWVAAAIVVAACTCAPAWATFGFAEVQAAARELASKPYQAPADELAPALASLTHAQYRSISYNPDARLWAGEKTPFSVGFLVRGNNYHDRVRINEIDATGAHEITFDRNDFDFGDLDLSAGTRADAGFSGFTLHLRAPRKIWTLSPATPALALDAATDVRIMTFQGASFIHGPGRGQSGAGATARGLAVDTGLMSGEEFPRFVEFWIRHPGADDAAVVILALLDSRRVTGAYRFAVHPGATLRVDVQARLYLREPVTVLGLAPLDSMYFYGENDHRHDPGDYRPEVHGSDGLQIHAGNGEWIWRPLLNPRRLLVTSFAMDDPQGFGLMQRDLDFASYQDLDRRYDQSSSVWVTPAGPWGAGRVELVMLPTPDATNNNIVAFWAPEKVPEPQQPFDLAYRLEWQRGGEQTRPPGSWVTQTRAYPIAVKDKPADLGLVIDFEGPALKALAPADAVTALVASDQDSEVVAQRVVYNGATGGRRLTLQARRADAKKPMELRASLRTEGGTVSETWSYIVPGEE